MFYIEDEICGLSVGKFYFRRILPQMISIEIPLRYKTSFPLEAFSCVSYFLCVLFKWIVLIFALL